MDVLLQDTASRKRVAMLVAHVYFLALLFFKINYFVARCLPNFDSHRCQKSKLSFDMYTFLAVAVIQR